MFEESRAEFLLRWYMYRWRKKAPHRLAEFLFYRASANSKLGDLFLDLGANIGLVTGAALRLGFNVIAFEPDPKALLTLQARFGGDPRVQIIPKAVGGSARLAKFYRRSDEDTEWSSLTRIDVHAGGEIIDVEVIDLVEFIRRLDQPVSVLKMDIEGAEAECLEAILDAGLHRQIGYMLVETHERFSAELAARTEGIRKRVNGIPNINLDWI